MSIRYQISYSNPSPYGDSYFAVSLICGLDPRIKIHYSDPSMDMSIKIFRQLQQEFKPQRMMFKELKGKEEAGPIYNVSANKKKTKILKHFFSGRGAVE